MQIRGRFFRGTPEPTVHMNGGRGNRQYDETGLRGLRQAAPIELVPRGGLYVPVNSGRRRRIWIPAGIAICLLAGVWQLVRTAPEGDTTVRVSDITTDSATITWNTTEPSASQVEYGTTAAYGSLSEFSPPPLKSHSVRLSNLAPGTTYNYAALSTNSAGQVRSSANFTFATAGVAGSPAMSHIAVTGVTTNSAIISWLTAQPLTSQVAYGTTEAYGSLSGFSASPVTSHSVTLTALAPGTTYYSAALSTGAGGETSKSPNFTFTTVGATGPPSISDVTATDITANAATIKWTTNQASASQVEFGATTAYGSLSAFNASPVTSHSLTLPGLTPGRSYNYAALSVNAAGRVGKSANATFTTPGAAPLLKDAIVSNITATTATITWTTDQPAASQVAYGMTLKYGFLSAYNTALVTAHAVTLSGLKPGTSYHCAASSTNSAGMQNSSADIKFTTPAGLAHSGTRSSNTVAALVIAGQVSYSGLH
jgi:hypothetical protein